MSTGPSFFMFSSDDEGPRVDSETRVIGQRKVSLKKVVAPVLDSRLEDHEAKTKPEDEEEDGLWTKVSNKRSKKKTSRRHSSGESIGSDSGKKHRNSLGGGSVSTNASSNSSRSSSGRKSSSTGGGVSSRKPSASSKTVGKTSEGRGSAWSAAGENSLKQKLRAQVRSAAARKARQDQATASAVAPVAPESKRSGQAQEKLQPPADLAPSQDSSVEEELRRLEDKQKQLRVKHSLISNVNRAVDELYYQCERDSALDSCKNAEEVLEHWLFEFKELHARIKSQHVNSNKTGLAWEVRKASPSPLLVSKDSAWVKKPNIVAAASQLKHSVAAPVVVAAAAPHAPSQPSKLQSLRKKGAGAAGNRSGALARQSAQAAAGARKFDQDDVRLEEEECVRPARKQTLRTDVDIPRNSASPEIDEDEDDGEEDQVAAVALASGRPGVTRREEKEEEEEEEEEKQMPEESRDVSNNQDQHELLDENEDSDDDMILISSSGGLMWGDESVGLDSDSVAVVSPKRARLTISTSNLAMRSLHEKLSSPERRKPSPFETKRRQTEKQAMAKLNREKMDLERQAKLQRDKSRQEQVLLKEKHRLEEQEQALSDKMERAAAARQHRLQSVAKKAENESLKVNEVAFINELTELERTAQLHRKLEEGEKRRKEFIGTIQNKAAEQNQKAQALREREERKAMELREAMQKRHEDAEKRKQDALEEHRRHSEHMARSQKVIQNKQQLEIEQQKRVEEVMERSKERGERADLQRKNYLLAKVKNSAAPCSPSSSARLAARLLQEQQEQEQEKDQAQQQQQQQQQQDGSNESADRETEVQKEERLTQLQRSMKKRYRKSCAKLKELANPTSTKLPNKILKLLDRVQADPAGLVSAIMARSSGKSSAFSHAEGLVRGGHVVLVVDACVALSTANKLDKLVAAVGLLQQCFAIALSSEQNEAALEMVRLCIYSSLVLRIGEQGTLLQDASLICASMGLLEAMAQTIKSNCPDNVNPQSSAAGSAFMQAAETSCMFHIVSQLIAAFIGIESQGATRSKGTAKQRRDREGKIMAAAFAGLRTLNLFACLDLKLMQTVLGSPDGAFELQQLLRYVLDRCANGDAEMPAPPATMGWGRLSAQLTFAAGTTTVDPSLLFAELIVFMGFYAESNEKNQESLNWGRAPTPLSQLLQVPFQYFVNPIGKSLLLPTLLSICCNNKVALDIVTREINPKLLTGYLAHREQNYAGIEQSGQLKRFPKTLWKTAETFLLEN